MIPKIILSGFMMAALLPAGAQTQAHFFSAIKVEFEKSISVRQLYKETQPEWYERIKDRLPVTALSYFEFTGDSSRSIFKPGKDVPIDPRASYRAVADKNIVFTDFKKGRTISQKPVFEETFLVEDSLLNIKWKITGDLRTIAGFECHKAIGILDDSIGIFAFYTDELMVSGGPEGIQGLPGMILGLGIPRLHTTWFATRVEVNDVDMKKVLPATKGKKVNRLTLMQSLEKVMKDWGPSGGKMIINFII
ncbi:MAG TPA: GLPGLI family protein [Chitinophagaceae bacterium]|nr:GLPGLI family protein [Chitinophagaceae bacterium]